MKALRRILSRVADRTPAREQRGDPRSAAAPVREESAASAPTEGRRRRRRGRRGRGGGGATAATGGQAATSAAPAERPAPAAGAPQPGAAGTRARGSRDGGGAGRDGGGASRDGGGGSRRGRGPVRGLGNRRRGQPRRLEDPLPEDVAFRPAAEGGDDSLLARRRPPRGLRTTNRVILVGGRRYLPAVGASRTQEERAGEDSPEAPLPAPDGADGSPADGAGVTGTDRGEDAEAASRPRPRRRGRRGGRRHRRPETEPAAPAGDDGASSAPSPAGGASADASPDSPGGASVDAPPAPPVGELPRAFSVLGVADRSLAVLAGMGFTQPTPIQERALPILFAGRDVVGVAQTGSGKTLAFALPLVELVEAGRREVQAVVLVPTRELAQQVLGVLEQVAAPYGLSVVGLLGGRALAGDFRALEGRPQVVVGTPGRILDHLRRGTLELRRVRYAVLDEADEMLDIGFLPDITRILQRTPRRRQTALFSATMPHAVMRLVRRYMEDPATVSVAEQHDTVDTIDQYYVEVAHRDKLRGLRELVDRELKGRTLVFSRTRRGVDYVSARLQEMGVSAGALHGDMDQRRRDQVVRRFRQGELDLLVATNVAARGLDIPEITHVVNFDVPQNAEEYVHRVGRTGRAGRHGTAITLVSEHDIGEFDVLLSVFGDRMRQERLALYEPA